MIDELTIGRRYRLTLKSKAFPGWLEGRLRSVKLPRGVLGNEDGTHSIWLSGESFEWFLRPDEIETVQELGEDTDEIAPPPLLPERACARRIVVSRGQRRHGPSTAPTGDQLAARCHRGR
jgi:hypothetical protein